MSSMEYEDQGLLHHMFVRAAKKYPDRVAVVGAKGSQMTYKELDEATDILAANICLRPGFQAGHSIVGIYMERCLNYVVAYIAILKAGGSYMPIDVSYPITLLEDIFGDAQPLAVIAEASMIQYLPDTAKNVIVTENKWIDMLAKENDMHSVIPPTPVISLDARAYTVYSSGTTGKPKGIQCPHRGAVFSYTHRNVTFPYVDGEREACNVFFVWELLRPLTQGVTLYVIPDSVIYDPQLLCSFLEEHAITRVLFTPSLLEAVLNAEHLDVSQNMRTLRTIIFCGEVVTVGLLERCLGLLPHVQFLNLYSVSEAHDIAITDLTAWYNKEKSNLKNTKFCPVGKLLPGVSVVILNEKEEPQPKGVSGEIYVAGPTLAIGYLNRPELNAKRFIERPEGVNAKVGNRLYKTGDWGYLLSDGSFEICGRCDSMVKIRGYSIETQAVEAALLEVAQVNACVVVVSGDEGEDKTLVAYIVPEPGATKKEIRAALKKRLPFYMIPSHFIFLQCMPTLASSGKLDKKQLPAVDAQNTELDPEGMPSTDTERQLAAVWGSVLQLEVVDIHESFFDLGGHSLLAARLLGMVKEKFALELSVKDLFVHSTVSAMAALITSQSSPGQMPRSPSIRHLSKDLDLRKEVEKHGSMKAIGMNMQLRSFWRSMQYGHGWDKSRVLLTGATGFLGSFILRDLLVKTNTHIFCIVRELPDQDLTVRLRDTLVKFGMLPGKSTKLAGEQEVLEAKFTERVTAIKGDVGLMNMGMSDDDYGYLSTEIDFIIHTAAYVNLIYPYQALHGPNVLGTQNVVLFACTGKMKPLHYVSTDAVFPHGLRDCSEDSDMLQYANDLEDGYSQSKWVAEQLVINAMEHGLPAVIYRPGNLSGDQKEANWNPSDYTLLMLTGCLQAGAAPDMDWDMEFTPVDFVSGLIVTLTQRMGLALGKILHLTNPETVKSQWLFEWINAQGYRLKMMPYPDWLKFMENFQKKKSSDALQQLLDSMAPSEEFFHNLSTYNHDNTMRILKVLKIENYPQINSKLLKVYFKHLSKRRIFPLMRRNTTLDRPLEDKVAIVTGASSGIGAAIAQKLARAGCKVAMAARRLERLQEIKSEIESNGGISLAIKTDVTDREQFAELVRHTEYTLGPVDILVNNAGVMYFTMMKNLQVDEWEKQVDLNIKGVLNGIGSVLNGMLERKSGHIVNMSSDAGKRGFAGLAVYSGTKFFVEGLSQGMRHELCKSGVKVTCIQPGDVKTELITHTTDAEAKDAYDGSESTKILDPEDVAGAVLYAVSQPPHVAINELLIEPREAPI